MVDAEYRAKRDIEFKNAHKGTQQKVELESTQIMNNNRRHFMQSFQAKIKKRVYRNEIISAAVVPPEKNTTSHQKKKDQILHNFSGFLSKK